MASGALKLPPDARTRSVATAAPQANLTPKARVQYCTRCLLDMGVSKKSVSWTSRFVTMVLQENRRRSAVPFVVQTFWTPPYLRCNDRLALHNPSPRLLRPTDHPTGTAHQYTQTEKDVGVSQERYALDFDVCDVSVRRRGCYNDCMLLLATCVTVPHSTPSRPGHD